MTFTSSKKKMLAVEESRRMIMEMIDASFELSEKLGQHPLTKGCNCIVCINQRKALLEKRSDSWQFIL